MYIQLFFDSTKLLDVESFTWFIRSQEIAGFTALFVIIFNVTVIGMLKQYQSAFSALIHASIEPKT